MEEQDNQNQIQQGQDIYVQGEDPLSAEEELTQIAPPEEYESLDEELPPEEEMPPPPPMSFGEKLISGLKKFFIPLVLIVIAVGLIFLLIRFLTGGGNTAEKKADLTYWILWEDEEVFSPLIADYKKDHPNVNITVVKQTPKEYRERLENAILSGKGPDMFRFHNTWLPMLLKKGVIAPVPEKVMSADDFSSTFYPVVEKDLKVGGSYYGIPLMFDALGLYYNVDILQAAGAKPPKTWTELQTVANELTVRDPNGRIITSGIALGTTNNVMFWPDILGLMILQNGGSIINPDSQTGETNVQDAILVYTRFAQPPNNVWDKTLENSLLAFASGRVAMIFAPSWAVFEIKAMNKDLNFRIAPVPQLPKDPRFPVQDVGWATYWVEGVSSKSKNQEAAFFFLKYLSERESLTRLFTEEAKTRDFFGEPYSRIDLASQLKGDPYLDSIISQGPIAKSGYLSSRTFDNGLNDRIIKYYENAVNSIHQGSSPQAAVDTVRKGIAEILSDFGLAGK